MGEDREINMNLRLTGREIHRSVRNFIKDELNFDPVAHHEAVIAESRETARKIVVNYLAVHFGKPSDIEWLARQVVNSVTMEDHKTTIRKEIEWAVAAVVKEKRKELEAVIRAEIEANRDELVTRLVQDALAKTKGK
jgi:hypothetical protein